MKNERVLLFLLAAAQFTHIIDFMIIMPLGELLMEELHIGSRAFSWLVASYTITAGVSGFASAFVVDRFDRKNFFLVAYLGFSLGTVLCGMADGFWWLMAARVFTGFFGGVISSTVMAIVGDAIAPERRAWGMGVLMSSFSVAAALGLPIGLYFSFQFGWQSTFTGLGVLSLVNATAVFFLLPSVRSHLAAGRPSMRSGFDFVMNVPNNKNQWMALLYTMLLMFGHFTVVPFITPYLVHNVGFEREQITLVYLVGGLCTFITNPRFGRWADKTGRYRVFVILALASMVPIAALTNMPPVPVWAALIVTALYFILAGGRMVPSSAIVASVIRPKNRGSFMSLNSAAQNITAGLGSTVGGWLVFVPEGGASVEGFWVAGIFSVLFTLFAVFMVRHMRRFESLIAAES